MNIKHFAGYGKVTVTKLSKSNVKDGYGEKFVRLVIRVKGNHEWGLERDDRYDIHRWLVTKFVRDCADYMDIQDYHMNDYYVQENDLDVEVCDYTIIYKPTKK